MWLRICYTNNLRRHLKIHTGEKSFICNLCDFASVHELSLRTHLKIHVTDKEFKCNSCDYASVEASKLRRHLKTHTGEKSHKCNQCDYASNQAGNLKTHLKIHSWIKSNKCNVCDYACSDPSSFRRHLKKHIGKRQTNASNVTLPQHGQAVWCLIYWKHVLHETKSFVICFSLSESQTRLHWSLMIILTTKKIEKRFFIGVCTDA